MLHHWEPWKFVPKPAVEINCWLLSRAYPDMTVSVVRGVTGESRNYDNISLLCISEPPFTRLTETYYSEAIL